MFGESHINKSNDPSSVWELESYFIKFVKISI